jgi:uncharacterized protein
VSTDTEQPPTWRPWTAPAALVLALAMGLVAGSIVLAGVAIITGDAKSTPAGTIVATIFGDICFVGSALFFAQLTARPTLRQFGLTVPSLKTSLIWMAAAYVVFLTFSGLWLSLLDIPSKDHSLDDLGQTSAALAAAAVLVTVIAPVAEEFLFRGYIFGALRGWAGVWAIALLAVGALTVLGLLLLPLSRLTDRSARLSPA